MPCSHTLPLLHTYPPDHASNFTSQAPHQRTQHQHPTTRGFTSVTTQQPTSPPALILPWWTLVFIFLFQVKVLPTTKVSHLLKSKALFLLLMTATRLIMAATKWASLEEGLKDSMTLILQTLELYSLTLDHCYLTPRIPRMRIASRNRKLEVLLNGNATTFCQWVSHSSNPTLRSRFYSYLIFNF